MMLRNPFKYLISKKSSKSRLEDNHKIDRASNRSEPEENLDIATEALDELLISSDTGSLEDVEDEEEESGDTSEVGSRLLEAWWCYS